ncbi:glycosyltransferase family 2 protein [Lactococcus ileimucosae]|uniref:glycosyltransferase family 2 protein n=1 Tax=Lactococcus ileimucosae TaxID=2941329 RepID=UPI002043E70F|nr:glycosyltransferase family 2 protein [Lactococcus ileimucosae]
MGYSLTILTPTYNRAYVLPKLYESLTGQTNLEFTWLVVDDGSSDNTEELINEFIKEEKIKIVYIKQENGGKHRALNTGAKAVTTDAVFVVDSDDYLTSDAVETILSSWNIVKENALMGISLLRGYSETEVIGEEFPENYLIKNFNEVRYNMGIKGDKAEIIDAEIMKSSPFPDIPSERFMSEGVAWKEMAKKGDSLFINKIIYITEYLEDGYTSSGRMLLINNPLGAMLNAKMAMTDEFTLKVRLRNALLYIAYGYVAHKNRKEIVQESGQKALVQSLLPFGWLFYHYWKLKYKF